MNDVDVLDNQMIIPTRKRVRRNAIKPNSAESTALKEFSILHTLNDKLDINNESEKRQRREIEEIVADVAVLDSEQRPETEGAEEVVAVVVSVEASAEKDPPSTKSDGALSQQ